LIKAVSNPWSLLSAIYNVILKHPNEYTPEDLPKCPPEILLKVAQWMDKKIDTLLDDMMKLENECLPDIRCTEWWTQFWQNLQNAFSQQPLSSGDNLRDSNQANGPGFEDETNEEQSEEEELREEIEEDVDECNLDPDDPWCASLRGE
jgi:hypothetical protein